jgi:long-chain acyl-CoA synthetase
MLMPLAAAISRSIRAVLAPFRRRGRAAGGTMERPYPWERSYPTGIEWPAAFEARPLTGLFDDAVAAWPDNFCFSFHGRRTRYREVARMVDRAAKGFQALGVGKGIKVGLMLPNTPYTVICFYAVLKAGGTVVNINPLCAEREIERQIADSGLCILVTLNMKRLYRKVAPRVQGDGQLERIVVCSMSDVLRFPKKVLFDLLKRREVAAIPKDDRHLPFDKLIDNDGGLDEADIDPETDVAVLQYTGGTTGFPKAVRLTHANLYANAKQLEMWAPDARPGEEKILGVLPLFHAFGMTAVMNLGLGIGAELILLPHFKLVEVLQAIDQEKPTIFIGVPTMYSALNAARDIADYDLSSLSFCISGGAPLAIDTHGRFEERTGCVLVEGYGLSETGPVCTVNPINDGRRPGSTGLPLPATVIEITALDNPDCVLPLGDRGEVCVSGPQVMAGYANRARENIDVFRGGRLHTGDIGYLDDDGYLYVVDRIKDLILSSGFNVYPRMVEEVIHLHPAVEEVAVCGVPDRHRGEIVKAFVKLGDGEELTVVDLRVFLKDKLAPFQMPRKIEFRDSLPKTLIGKISKKDLIAEDAAGQLEPEPTPVPAAGT